MFSFRLALAMGRTRDDLMRSMSSAEFCEWMAFAELEPFGSLREDYRAGLAAAATVNVWRSSKDEKVTAPLDFFPEYQQQQQQQQQGQVVDLRELAPHEIREMGRLVTAAMAAAATPK